MALTRDGITARAYRAPNGAWVFELTGPVLDAMSPDERHVMAQWLLDNAETGISWALSGHRRLPAPRPARSVVSR